MLAPASTVVKHRLGGTLGGRSCKKKVRGTRFEDRGQHETGDEVRGYGIEAILNDRSILAPYFSDRGNVNAGGTGNNHLP